MRNRSEYYVPKINPHRLSASRNFKHDAQFSAIYISAGVIQPHVDCDQKIYIDLDPDLTGKYIWKADGSRREIRCAYSGLTTDTKIYPVTLRTIKDFLKEN
jgi:hypothetical protein